MITVPYCYVTTECIGEPINTSITFSDCCANFGVSYDWDGRCFPCPSTLTSKYYQNIFYKIFVCNFICKLYTSLYYDTIYRTYIHILQY